MHDLSILAIMISGFIFCVFGAVIMLEPMWDKTYLGDKAAGALLLILGLLVLFNAAGQL